LFRYSEALGHAVQGHDAKLKNFALKEQYEHELSTVETVFISEGLQKLKEDLKGKQFFARLSFLKFNFCIFLSDDIPAEMSFLQGWYYEMRAFRIKCDEARGQSDHTELEKVFAKASLCDRVEYKNEDGLETLSFSTTLDGKTHSIDIK
jgi:hypothetical protein